MKSTSRRGVSFFSKHCLCVLVAFSAAILAFKRITLLYMLIRVRIGSILLATFKKAHLAASYIPGFAC